MPTASIASVKTLALPSAAGISGPSTAISALSTPSRAAPRADVRRSRREFAVCRAPSRARYRRRTPARAWKFDRVVEPETTSRGRPQPGNTRTRAGTPVWSRPPPSRSRRATSSGTAPFISASARRLLFFFEGLDAGVEFGQAANIRLKPDFVAMVLGRVPGDGRSVLDVAPHVRPAADGGPVADLRMCPLKTGSGRRLSRSCRCIVVPASPANAASALMLADRGSCVRSDTSCRSSSPRRSR